MLGETWSRIHASGIYLQSSSIADPLCLIFLPLLAKINSDFENKTRAQPRILPLIRNLDSSSLVLDKSIFQPHPFICKEETKHTTR